MHQLVETLADLIRQATIRKELQRLLGPKYFWYHVNSKFPQKILETSGDDKEKWKELRPGWAQSSRGRVEVRLRCVKDPQTMLADIVRSKSRRKPKRIKDTPTSPMQLSGRESPSSPLTATRNESPTPTMVTDQSTMTDPSVLTSFDNALFAPSLSLPEALARSLREKPKDSMMGHEPRIPDATLYDPDDEDAMDLDLIESYNTISTFDYQLSSSESRRCETR
jgi:hypothetical protein